MSVSVHPLVLSDAAVSFGATVGAPWTNGSDSGHVVEYGGHLSVQVIEDSNIARHEAEIEAAASAIQIALGQDLYEQALVWVTNAANAGPFKNLMTQAHMQRVEVAYRAFNRLRIIGYFELGNPPTAGALANLDAAVLNVLTSRGFTVALGPLWNVRPNPKSGQHPMHHRFYDLVLPPA